MGVFNEGVEEVRKTLLPAIVQNFDNMSQEERELIGEVFVPPASPGQFWHRRGQGLENTRRQCRRRTRPVFIKSGTFRLIRTAAKGFTQRGCDKSGVHAYWNTFLKGRDTRNKLVTFYGHIINLAFHDGAAV